MKQKIMKQKILKNKSLFIQITTIIIALCLSFFYMKDHRMSDNWMGPYLSAAHNLSWAGTFKISIEEVNDFKDLSIVEQDSYDFKAENILEHYNHNPIGYAYIIKIATIMFPFLGDQAAIIILQCLIYLLINIIFLSLKEFDSKQKWLFFIIFSINPILLRFVPFNFYYFWQLIPFVIFGYLMLSKTPNKKIVVPLIILLPLVILTRPNLVFSLLFVFHALYKKFNYKFLIISSIYFIGLIMFLYQPTKKNIWHTVYAGIGAYENEYGIKLSDKDAYDLYEKETGEKLNASVGGNYYEEIIIDKYSEITKKESLVIIKNKPLMLIKNAILNTLQGYSIGYINKGGDMLNYIIALSGVLYFIYLVYFKKYIWVLMIGLSVGNFTLFYPPIQSYMYGSYLLIITCFVSTLSKKTYNNISIDQ